MTAKEIGALIARTRADQGMTQHELAAVTNMSARTVHAIENGKPSAQLQLVLNLLDGLGIEVHLEAP